MIFVVRHVARIPVRAAPRRLGPHRQGSSRDRSTWARVTPSCVEPTSPTMSSTATPPRSACAAACRVSLTTTSTTTPDHQPDDEIGEQRRRRCRRARRGQASIAWCSGRHAVREDAAADQEHRRGAGDRQGLHQPGRRRAGCRGRAARRAPGRCPRAGSGSRPSVVELHDAGHQAVDADRHDQRDADQHRHLRHERLAAPPCRA